MYLTQIETGIEILVIHPDVDQLWSFNKTCH